jgi:hypothetical protein
MGFGKQSGDFTPWLFPGSVGAARTARLPAGLCATLIAIAVYTAALALRSGIPGTIAPITIRAAFLGAAHKGQTGRN